MDKINTSSKLHLKMKSVVNSHALQLLFAKRVIILIFVSVVVVGLSIYWYNHTKSSNLTRPNYQVVLPTSESISKLGGWRRVSPSGKDPVFAYSDVIDGVTVSVSQQPLPQSFKQDTDDQVADLARKFSATTKIDAGNTTVYVGTSSKGPQSAILTKKNLLILIKSQKKIDDSAWAKYAESLN